MTKRKLLFGALIALVLIVLAALFWNTQQNQITEKSQMPQAPTKLPSQNAEKCGIENCHGLDITCGSNVPDMCTMSYMLGDGCRQYARCEKKDGTCQLALSPQFENCKSCVQKCENDFRNSDPDKLFTCESTCAKID